MPCVGSATAHARSGRVVENPHLTNCQWQGVPLVLFERMFYMNMFYMGLFLRLFYIWTGSYTDMFDISTGKG